MQSCTYPIEALLPHAHPMVLLDRVMGWAQGVIETELTIRSNSLFFEPGKGVAAHIAIEWMAQTCGAYVGLDALTQSKSVRIGFLLGTRNFTAERDWFQAGDAVSVTAELVFQDGETGVFDCTVRCCDALAAKAQLTLYQPADLAAVLASQGIRPRDQD